VLPGLGPSSFDSSETGSGMGYKLPQVPEASSICRLSPVIRRDVGFDGHLVYIVVGPDPPTGGGSITAPPCP